MGSLGFGVHKLLTKRSAINQFGSQSTSNNQQQPNYRTTRASTQGFVASTKKHHGHGLQGGRATIRERIRAKESNEINEASSNLVIHPIAIATVCFERLKRFSVFLFYLLRPLGVE
ncbi:hypothetical protein ACLKA7_009402 [Drosophila subpalustris]